MHPYSFVIKTTTESTCVAELMKMYQELTNNEKSNVPNIPYPCTEEVEKWLNHWENLPEYTEAEKALNKLFLGDFKSNDNLSNILIKCSTLNDFYSTNIFKIYPVAVHIHSLNIDQALKKVILL